MVHTGQVVVVEPRLCALVVVMLALVLMMLELVKELVRK